MIDRAFDPKSPFLTEDDDQPIEIEIGDPNAPVDTEAHVEFEKTPAFDANLADFVDDDELVSLASDLVSDFENDRGSRKEWEQTYVDGLDLLGLKIEERTTPWNGACGVYHPMLTEAAIRFQSEMISETFPAIGPCRGKYIGDEDEKARESVSRVVKDVNYNITEKMTEFRAEHEKMLWALSLAGAAFKKVYFDPSLNRQVSMFVPAEDLYLPYGASDARTAERVTHVMRKTKNDIKKLQYSGFYRDVELGEPSRDITDIQERKDEVDGLRANWDDRYKILEMMVELDLKGFEDIDPDTGEETGIALPYVVTIEKGTNKVLSIRRNWDEHDPYQTSKSAYCAVHLHTGFWCVWSGSNSPHRRVCEVSNFYHSSAHRRRHTFKPSRRSQVSWSAH